MRSRTESPSIIFNSTLYARLLADFYMENRTDVLQKKFKWVLEAPNLVSFASALFDSGATITLTEKKKAINFDTTHEAVGDFYLVVLKRLGIKRRRVSRGKA